ncbi:hypothetical protein LBBP_03011 [Leptospira borgpetersenii serovar Ballum]|uniref:Uncharacterized protein n=2 Tax=Leptospira borgpetersenii serovar Ballum TaxID=280505 RepID=A0A0S2IUA8_LEPBO|nr:hypothetical protein LBBP_03011 [Leptospira borgpetersenii serovar Ballum]
MIHCLCRIYSFINRLSSSIFLEKLRIIMYDSYELLYSASQKPNLLCQKDQAARFCPSFGTEPCIRDDNDNKIKIVHS